MKQMIQRLDYHFFLSHQFIHHKGYLIAVTLLYQHHMPPFRMHKALGMIPDQPVLKIEERNGFFAEVSAVAEAVSRSR